MKYHLLTPGPVELSHSVMLAGAKELIGHRGYAFSALFESIQKKLEILFKVKTPFVVLPSSGTGALESMTVNFLTEKDTFLSVSCGAFGERFREIAMRTGAKCIALDIPLGSAVMPDEVAKLVASHPEASVLLLTQNETSTGVLNPIKEIINAIPYDKRPFILVDGVSSVGAMECSPEDWGIDALGTASQKGLLTPPGLGLVWLSERAWKFLKERNCSSYYFDLKLHKKYLDLKSPENPYTPPVSLYYALDAALDEILKDGADLWFESRVRYAKAFAAGLKALGFDLLVSDEKYRSCGVTAFSHKTQNMALIKKELTAMGIDTAGGQGELTGKIIRVAHYSDQAWPDLCMVLGSLYAALDCNADNGTAFLNEAWNIWNMKGKK